MECKLSVRVKVLEVLNKSLKAEHYKRIREKYSDYKDGDDADNLLCYMEYEKNLISMNNYYRLIELLKEIGLGSVAKQIPTSQKMAEEEYKELKKKIIEIFNDKNNRRNYMGQFKNKTIDFYKLDRDSIEHCYMEEIIEELEERQLLSSSEVDKFQRVFRSCGCKPVVELIDSMVGVEEETPMDTDATDARPVNTSEIYGGAQPTSSPVTSGRQGTQEENPGSSGSTSFGRGDQGPKTTIKQEQTSARVFSTGSGLHQRPQPQTHPQPHPQAEPHGTGTGCYFSGNSSVGTNVNIASGTHIEYLNISSGNQGQAYIPRHDNYTAQDVPRGPDAYFPEHGSHIARDIPKPPGFLSDTALLFLCGRLGSDWRTFGLQLRIDWPTIERIHCSNRKTEDAIMQMLMQWRKNRGHTENQLEKMCSALISHGNRMLADDLREWMKKY